MPVAGPGPDALRRRGAPGAPSAVRQSADSVDPLPAASLPVVVGLVGVRRGATDTIEGKAQHSAVGRLQPTDRPLQVAAIGAPLRGDHDGPHGHAPEDGGVGDGEHGGVSNSTTSANRGSWSTTGFIPGLPSSSLGLSRAIPAGSSWSPKIPVSTNSEDTDRSSRERLTPRPVREGAGAAPRAGSRPSALAEPRTSRGAVGRVSGSGAFQVALMRSARPGSPVAWSPKISSSLGRRKSAETTMTLLPLIAHAAARLAVTKVLPSPASGLVTRTNGHGASSRITRTLVRNSRTASAICDWGAWTMAMVTLPERTSGSSGSSARMGASEPSSNSEFRRTRVSKWSLSSAIPMPTNSPAINPMAINFPLLKPVGVTGVSAATWMDA